jgi:5-methylcytosine-specific restriction endonuclease McrA
MPTGIYQYTPELLEKKKAIGRIQGILNRGRIHTEKTKENMSLAHIGQPAWNKGLKGYQSGEKNGNWKGGISKTKEYKKLLGQQRYSRHKKGGKLYISIIQMVYEDNIKKYGTLTCIYCLNPIKFGKDTLEHKQPLILGGTNEYNNLAIACNRCNSSKGSKTEAEYRKEL